MTCLINTERARHGLRPLAVHTKLMEMARRHSNYQSAMRHMTHSDTAGSLGSRATQVGFSWNFLEENVASFAMSEEEAMKAWMASPSHRENILSRNVEFFGAAVSDGFWTQEFGNMMDKTRSPRVLEGCPSAENLVVYS
ncbi:SCP-domain-containing protein [Ramicandelaber brevisporus]|nr:SCP-domain-containing protein [Ramicandelaber brevisporus]